MKLRTPLYTSRQGRVQWTWFAVWGKRGFVVARYSGWCSFVCLDTGGGQRGQVQKLNAMTPP